MRINKSFTRHFFNFGNLLSDMVVPNLGAFIAWGLMSAMFSRSGWFPNPALNQVSLHIGHYLLPLALAYSGGRMTGGQRGGLVAIIATIGLITAMHESALFGAMIIGPTSGWITRVSDGFFRLKTRQGFELIVNNFSAALLSIVMCLVAYFGLAPLIAAMSAALAHAANWLISARLIPLANVIVEPAKVFFMNNAVNHGILNPLGTEQAQNVGQSLLFLIETNPGPGLGILLGFSCFGRGTAKHAAPAAMVIQALGGIHEIYFPYVLKQPRLLLAAIAGGVSGTATFNLLNVGLRADPAPGSLISILALTPSSLHNYLGVLLGIAISTVVSFAGAALLLPHTHATKQNTGLDAPSRFNQNVIITGTADMGSPAMGARVLESLLRQRHNHNQSVSVQLLNQLGDTHNAIIFVRSDLVDLVREQAPDAQEIIGIQNYLRADSYQQFVFNHA